uniref:Uncharacterized protein n=1 Tax=Tetradesmus obliquus TaxID=3088 RepID=A0A383WC21_TETOB
MARANEDCLDSAKQMAGAMAVAGVPVGFFKAHVTLKDMTLQEKMQRWQNVKLTARIIPQLTHLLLCHDMTLQEKMQRWQNVKLTARIMANPMATFAAAGFAYKATECSMRHYLGREDSLNSMVGGAAVGAVLGLKANSGAVALKYGALVAGTMLITDFLTKMVPALTSDLKSTGPIEIQKKPAAASQ